MINYLYDNAMVLSIFFGLSILNVICSTIKSIMTVKGTRVQATIINAFYYAFYTIVLKQVVSFGVYTTITITFLANMIGVYTSFIILDKFKKDKLWTISLTADTTETGKNIIKELKDNKLSYRYYTIYNNNGTTLGIDIFSPNQNESIKIKNILKNYKIKYHIIENEKRL